MKLIVGLGNPGKTYVSSRHNAGFLVLDALADWLGCLWKKDARRHAEVAKGLVDEMRILMAKPQTFMNASGDAVVALATFHKIQPNSILVIHDDLDLSPGSIRFKHGGGTAGHKGLDSICASLGTKEFDRLRIGIGKPARSSQMDEWVLGNMEAQTRDAISRATDAMHDWVTLGLAEAMNRWNAPTVTSR